MADRVLQEHMAISGEQQNIIDLVMPNNAAQMDDVAAMHFDEDFDINKHLFDIILQLKNSETEVEKNIFIEYINSIFNFWENQIDPSYIDPIHEAAVDSDEATLFAVINSLENINDEIVGQWLDKLSEILVLEIEDLLDQDIEFDRERYLKPLLKYNHDTEQLNALVLHVTNGAFDFIELQELVDEHEDIINMLLAPRVLKARNELGVGADVLVKLWEECEDDHPVRSIHNIFSEENRKHLLSSFGSAQLFERLVMSDFFQDADLQSKMQDPEHFKMLTSISLKFLVDMGFESLEFFANMAENELDYFLSQNDLNMLMDLISDRHNALEFLSSASMQAQAIHWHAPTVVIPSILQGLNISSNGQQEVGR
jgi:hypothetical protein